jgi:hypothetical protein
LAEKACGLSAGVASLSKALTMPSMRYCEPSAPDDAFGFDRRGFQIFSRSSFSLGGADRVPNQILWVKVAKALWLKQKVSCMDLLHR